MSTPYSGNDPRYLNGERPHIAKDGSGRKTLPNRVWVDPAILAEQEAERKARLQSIRGENANARLLPNRLTAAPSAGARSDSVSRETPKPIKRLDPRKDALGPEAGFAQKRNQAREADKRSKAVVLYSKTSQAGHALNEAQAQSETRLAGHGGGSGGGGTPSPGPNGNVSPDGAQVAPAPGKRPMPPLGWLAIGACILGGAYVLFAGDDGRARDDEDDEDDEDEVAA